MSTTVATQPAGIDAHVTTPAIAGAEVQTVNDKVLVNLVTEDHWAVVRLYLTPEAAFDLSDRLESTASELIDARMEPVSLGELADIIREGDDS